MEAEQRLAGDPPRAVVMPPNLDGWIEATAGPVVLLIQPTPSGLGDPQNRSGEYYAPHARYFDNEEQAIEWYEANRKLMQHCRVTRYPLVDGRRADSLVS